MAEREQQQQEQADKQSSIKNQANSKLQVVHVFIVSLFILINTLGAWWDTEPHKKPSANL